MKTWKSIFKSKQVRKECLYSFLILMGIRLLATIPTPGTNPDYFKTLIHDNSALTFIDAMTGNGLSGIAERFPRSGKFLSGPGQSLIYAPIMNKYYEKNVCSCVLEFWTRLDGLRYEICSYSNHMAAKAAAKIDLKDSVLCFMTTHNGVSTPYATTTIHNNRIGETFYEDAKN